MTNSKKPAHGASRAKQPVSVPGKEGHRARLRQKFVTHGLDKLTDEEIVELLLTLGTPRRDCKPQARMMLKKFGGLRGVLEAEPNELAEIPGVGPANSFGIRLIHEIARKFLRGRIIGRQYLESTADVIDYLKHAMSGLKHESFRIIHLDNASRILHEESLAVGQPGQVVFTTRQIAESAVKHSASGIVIVHNHPGGDAKPSDEDIEVTRELVFALRMIDIFVREHLIVADKKVYSFAREGLIDAFNSDYEKKFPGP